MRGVPIVIVEWHDAGVVATTWTDVDEARAAAERIVGHAIRSVGFLVADDSDHILICASLNPEHTDVSLCEVIPRANITSMEWVPRQAVLPSAPSEDTDGGATPS